MGEIYPVGIVGESNYQRAIGRAREGDSVGIFRELNNPYSNSGLAVRVDNSHGETIGYIANDHWLKDAINNQKKGCDARILGIEGSPMGVVLEVQLTDEEAPTIEFGKKSTPAKTEPSSIASIARNLLSRLS
ncbi:HIRAN domain-containing protein [Sneathiella sp.]|uniref:HIRAN domain-containing protein n=1 Tax=Sneathiella sp. TaxID=1964365 RepID=UPI0035683650